LKSRTTHRQTLPLHEKKASKNTGKYCERKKLEAEKQLSFSERRQALMPFELNLNSDRSAHEETGIPFQAFTVPRLPENPLEHGFHRKDEIDAGCGYARAVGAVSLIGQILQSARKQQMLVEPVHGLEIEGVPAW